MEYIKAHTEKTRAVTDPAVLRSDIDAHFPRLARSAETHNANLAPSVLSDQDQRVGVVEGAGKPSHV